MATAASSIEIFFPNPVKLRFHPPTLVEEKQEMVDVWSSCRKKHDHNEDWECAREKILVPDVPLQTIFADDLQRTLWLAAKARHLTCQYFRMDVVRCARRILRCAPLTSEQLWHIVPPLIGGGVNILGAPHGRQFAEQLYPHVLWVLIAAGKWPWIIPHTATPPTKLEWLYEPQPYPEWPHEFQWPHYYSESDRRQAMDQPQFTRCDACKKPITDARHVLRG